MKIFVAGGTGAIGRPLITELRAKGHALVALTRSPEKGHCQLIRTDSIVRSESERLTSCFPQAARSGIVSVALADKRGRQTDADAAGNVE